MTMTNEELKIEQAKSDKISQDRIDNHNAKLEENHQNWLAEQVLRAEAFKPIEEANAKELAKYNDKEHEDYKGYWRWAKMYHKDGTIKVVKHYLLTEDDIIQDGR